MFAWLYRLDRFFPVRYSVWMLCALGFAISMLCWFALGVGWLPALAFLFLVGLGFRDIHQSQRSVLRNYPVIGHLRFMLEFVRPEIRQYFIEGDNDAAPFSRQQRSLVYQRSKGDSDKRPFGTQLDVSAQGYEWINHSLMPSQLDSHDFRVLVGPNCTQPYSTSVFNISAMSFGALSANAILALNAGARRGKFAHDTGEGSISRYHREQGGDLIWEVGSGYFGCRNDDGSFNADRFAKNANEPQVKMIELKLSQGAKPGHGGVLPGPKVTPEIAQARGVPVGVDCVSPARHSAFDTPLEMMHFIERLRQLSGGKPTGFKLCIGHPWEWFAITKAMLETGITPDFIVVDGAEGGTGAAPLEFTDHVGAPLQEGLLLVHNTLVGLNLRDKIRLGCAGKVVSAFDIARMMALGADWCNSARGFMFTLGCIQAQHCHTGHCPTGVTTQDALRQQALVVPTKTERVYQFHEHTLKALKELVQAAGLTHPGQISASHIVRRTSDHGVKLLANLLPFVVPGALLAGDAPHQVFKIYWPMAQASSFTVAARAAPLKGQRHPIPPPHFGGGQTLTHANNGASPPHPVPCAMPRLLLLQNDAAIGEHLRRAIGAMPDMEVSGMTLTLSQAVRSMQLSPPDLVLVDLQVRRGDFAILLDELCGQPRDLRPLILVGALSLDDPSLMEAIAQGADGYYLHGSSPETLREAIVKVLDGESPMAPSIARQAKSLFEAPAWNSEGFGGDTREALRLSEAQLRMLERIGEGYLVHEVARELQTTEHEVGLGIRTLYRKLQFDRRAAAMAGQQS